MNRNCPYAIQKVGKYLAVFCGHHGIRKKTFELIDVVKKPCIPRSARCLIIQMAFPIERMFSIILVIAIIRSCNSRNNGHR